MKAIAVVASIALLSGCAIRSLGTSDSEDQIVLTDASSRAITAVRVDVGEDGRRVKPKRVLCAEPSPDIAKAVSSAIEASLGAKVDKPGVGTGSLDGNFSRSITESIAQLGSRLATIQLLRDELSDLCRSYANGAVSSITYTLRLSRLDKTMITLLVSEARAGALSRALVSISGSSGIEARSEEKLKLAEDRVSSAARAVEDAGKLVTDLNVRLSKASDDKEKEKLKANLTKAEEALKSRLDDLSDRAVEKLAIDTRGTGLIAASSASAMAGLPPSALAPLDLRLIHKSYLEDDDSGTLLDACLTSMEDNRPTSVASLPSDLKTKLTKAEQTRLDAELKVDALTRKIKTAQSSPSTALRETEMKELIAAEGDAMRKRLEFEQLQREAEDVRGVRDRTALLTFCRDEMKNITRMLERKISNKFELENGKNYIELCRSAVTSPGVTVQTKLACIDALLPRSR